MLARFRYLVQCGGYPSFPQTRTRNRQAWRGLSKMDVDRFTGLCVQLYLSVCRNHLFFPYMVAELDFQDDTSNPRVCRASCIVKAQNIYPKYPGLFTVPTRIILVVAPINALLNYLLGQYRPRLFFKNPLAPTCTIPQFGAQNQ
jgi:hypothetical protein